MNQKRTGWTKGLAFPHVSATIDYGVTIGFHGVTFSQSTLKLEVPDFEIWEINEQKMGKHVYITQIKNHFTFIIDK